MTAYEALYTDCIYESAYGTLSVHLSLRGAYDAMKRHRLKKFWEWRNTPKKYRYHYLETHSAAWHIRKTEILP